MPLPDERPRQSVATLVGRFEQKRQSLTGNTPPLPRSTSVVSHVTGDSVKEEIKEKREWPPKSTLQDEKSKATLLSSSSTTLSPPAPKSAPSPIKEATVPPTKAATEDSAPTATSEPAKTPKSTTATAKSPPVRKPVSTPIKTPAPKTSSTAKKSPVRSPPSRASALNASNSQPLRPQHTGTSTKSVISSPSSVRHTKSASKSVQSTPNRPKTPASSNTSRPKTPGSTPAAGASRPKTPSGLFAPTAASLAKARNAAVPAVPTPIKKATLSSSAAERLSKPTAASISKVRTPSLPGISPRGAKMAARRGTTHSTFKPRVASTKMKEMATKRNGNGVKVAAAETALESEVVGIQDAEHLSEEVVENGHDVEASGVLAEPENGFFADESVGLVVTEPEDAVVVEGTSHEEESKIEENTDEVELPTVSLALASESPSHEPESEEIQLEETSTGGNQDADELETPRPVLEEQEIKSHVPAGVDIHDIVNFLENAPAISDPKLHPLSVDGVPDDAPDIPDEE